METGIVVIFPGARYTCQEELLVKCAEKYETAGYHVIKLVYHQIPFKQLATYEEVISLCTPLILAQLKNIDFNAYTDIVFISKSVGTILACYFSEYFSISPNHLFLTPDQETLARIQPSFYVMGLVIGDEDPHIHYEDIVRFANKYNFPFLVIPTAGHNLKPEAESDFDAIRSILPLCKIK